MTTQALQDRLADLVLANADVVTVYLPDATQIASRLLSAHATPSLNITVMISSVG